MATEAQFSPRPVLWAGVSFDFGGGIVLVVPPLSCGALELLHERLNALPTIAITDPAAVATVVDAAHLALKRNYPAIGREHVAELVDVGNLGDVYECLMDVGGIKRRAQASARDAEQGNPAAPASAPVAGAPSTPE